MKLIFLLPDLKGGGAQKMIINMANEFAARNHDVTLITLSADGAYRNLIENKVRYKGLGKKRVGLSFFALRRELQKTEADILISALFHVNVMSLMVKTLTPLLKTRFIVTERNAFTSRIKGSNKLIDKFYPFLVKHLYKRADKVVGISKGVTEDIKRAANLKDWQVATIYNPVITKNSKLDSEAELEDIKLDTMSHPRLITSGRFVPQKDYPTLLKAFQIVLQKHHNASLIILGDGPDLEQVKDTAERLGITENIYLPGFVDNPLAYMKYADLFVISSRWEGFCNVIVEALYCGLPVVATNCPTGPAEILKDGKFGDLVPVENPESLANAMLEVLDNKTDPMVQKARAQDFTVEKICDRYNTIISNIMVSS